MFNTDARSPIFYDSNNTGYYLDPASTSNINSLNVSTINGRSTSSIFYYEGFTLDANTMNSNASGFTYSVNAPYTGPIMRVGDAGYSLQLNAPYGGNGYGLAFRTRNGDAGSFNSWQYPAVYNVNINGGGSLYATVYYDHNNTGYYVDPASTSSVNIMSTSQTYLGNSSAYALGANNWAGTGGYPGYSYTGGNNRFGFSSTGGYIDVYTDGFFYCGIDVTGANRRVLNEDQWISSKYFGSDGNIYSEASMRAPIFYDQNNTGYYVDPASTSYVNVVDARSYISSGNPWSTGNSAWFPNGITTPGVTSWLYGTVYLGNAPGNGAGTEATASGHIISTGEHRAAIYYDYNNTAYYIDAASNSVLYSLTVQGGTNNFNGITYFRTNNGGYCGSTDSAKLQAYSDSNNSAFMSFHKGGHYAVNFGLDADNVMRIGGWSAGANRLQLDMSGNLTMAGDVTAYSDRRVKENIITVDNALNKVLSLRGVYYNRIDSEDKKTKLGVIAQEILEVIPEVVGQDNDGMYNVSYGNLAGLFIEAIKEQQTQIEELKQLVNQLINK